MTVSKKGLTVLVVVGMVATGFADDSQDLAGPCLGQTPPGCTPEVFAPGIISTSGDEAILTVVEGGNVCYLTRSDPGFDGPWTEIPVLRSERRSNAWLKPTLVGSPGEPWYLGYREAEVGERVLFAWTPSIDGSGATSDIDIWSVEMTPAGWSEPNSLPSPINLEGVDSWPVVADSGALYFFSIRPGGLGHGDLYRAVDTGAENPIVEHLGNGVNSSAMEHDPCVAPDESFLVFASNRPGGSGGNDLYASFSSPTGGWSEPINLGPEVNSEFEDARPVLSSDGEMLYFTRQGATGMDVYRVPASAITAARLRDRLGPYLGEMPPGTTPQVFASGIVNTSDHEGCADFSRSGTRFLFHRLKKGLEEWTDIPVFLMEVEDGVWSRPRPAPFESQFQDWDYHFTPDGRWLYFTSMRPIEAGGEPPEHGNIWKVEITEHGWREPELLPPPINGPGHHDSSPSLTNDGTIYFFSSRDGGFGRADIYRSRLVDGDYVEPENLGSAINTEHSEYDLVIAPDESFLVFSSTRPGGFGDVDLYVSFRSPDDQWSEPKNLGPEVNATGAVFPSLTDDGKYLFFQSRPDDNGTVFWVSAEVIHSLR